MDQVARYAVGQRVYVPIELADSCCVMEHCVGVVGTIYEISDVVHATIGRRYVVQYPNAFQSEYRVNLKPVFTPLATTEQQEVCDLINSILDISCDQE
jgi:hypothetical protein